jgi:hypothetical protein
VNKDAITDVGASSEVAPMGSQLNSRYQPFDHPSVVSKFRLSLLPFVLTFRQSV